MMYWSWEPVYLAPYARRGVGPSMKRYMNLSRLMEDGYHPRVSKVAGPRIGGQIPFFRPQAELSAPAPSLRFALHSQHSCPESACSFSQFVIHCISSAAGEAPPPRLQPRRGPPAAGNVT